jgi:hypothetical protein
MVFVGRCIPRSWIFLEFIECVLSKSHILISIYCMHLEDNYSKALEGIGG